MILVFQLPRRVGFPLGSPGGGRGRLSLVPRYEFRCRACGDTFLVTRPMSESGAPAACPQGHDDTVKLLSTVAVGGRASGSSSSAPPATLGGGGGCCGGSCGCG
jgi:putative FmdB family regulatory protein